jgi:glycine/D-amino acid oxidase-like deaminating enzyme
MEARIGSAYYRCGVQTDEGYLLQPAALIRGLADTLPAPVRLFENAPVLDVEGDGPRVLRTPQARVRADHVVFATNAAIKHFGHWRDRLVTIHTYAGLTEALGEADLARLGVPAWGVLPAHRLGSTLRRVGADRLMIRSLYAYEAPIDSGAARQALAERLRRRYPGLAHVRLEYVWGGVTALTMNGAPRWGRIARGLYGSAGCNGAGIVKGTVLGRRLAEMIVTGDPQEDLKAAYGEADWIAPEPLRTIGFHVVSAYEKRKAGAEM